MIEFIRELHRIRPHSACLVRNTVTGQYYTVSTIQGETVAFNSDPTGERHDYTRVAGGRGMHRCEVMRLLNG